MYQQPVKNGLMHARNINDNSSLNISLSKEFTMWASIWHHVECSVSVSIRDFVVDTIRQPMQTLIRDSLRRSVIHHTDDLMEEYPQNRNENL